MAIDESSDLAKRKLILYRDKFQNHSHRCAMAPSEGRLAVQFTITTATTRPASVKNGIRVPIRTRRICTADRF